MANIYHRTVPASIRRSIRTLLRRGGVGIFAAVVTTELVCLPIADQLKARFNTPDFPILVSQVSMIAIVVACLALLIAAWNVETPGPDQDQ